MTKTTVFLSLLMAFYFIKVAVSQELAQDRTPCNTKHKNFEKCKATARRLTAESFNGTKKMKKNRNESPTNTSGICDISPDLSICTKEGSDDE